MTFLENCLFKRRPLEFSLGLEKEPSLIFYDAEYQSFLNWWQKNQEGFHTLSFRIDNQINLFFDQLPKIGLENALSQMRADLYGYYLEYIRQEGVIPFGLKLQDNGLIFGEFYGEKDIEEMVDQREREGVVKEAMGDLKSKLRRLKSDGIIFRISPSGWTGYDYDYKETQAQIFWRDKKEREKIRGLTIRTQLDLEEILFFLNDLGIEAPEGLSDEKEIIKWVVSLNIPLPCLAEEFLPIITNFFKGKDHQGRDLRNQIENWQRQDSDFFYFDKIADLINFFEKKIKQIKNVVYEDSEIRKEIRALLSFILMGMGASYIKTDLIRKELPWQWDSSQFLPDVIYNRIFNYLQSLPGCGGGGKNLVSKSIMKPFGLINVGSEELTDEIKCVTCPFCGKTVDAQIINDGYKKYIRCPECKAQVEKS